MQQQILNTEKRARIGGNCGELLVTRLFCASIVAEKWQKCRRSWAGNVFLRVTERIRDSFKGINDDINFVVGAF